MCAGKQREGGKGKEGDKTEVERGRKEKMPDGARDRENEEKKEGGKEGDRDSNGGNFNGHSTSRAHVLGEHRW